jgi:hypothetical protein
MLDGITTVFACSPAGKVEFLEAARMVSNPGFI